MAAAGGDDGGAGAGEDGAPFIPSGAPAAVAESGHMSLMDAIKAANGIKSLRHRSNSGAGDSGGASGGDGGDSGDAPPPPKKSEPVDMFSELKKKLGMRRNVMKSEEKDDSDGEWE